MSKQKWNKPTCQDLIEKALGGGKMGAKELAMKIGMSYQNVRQTMRLMHEAGEVFVAGWEKMDICHYVPVYALGNSPDISKPSPQNKPSAERARQYRESKQLRAEEEAETRLEMEIARKAKEALGRPVFRHPLDIALFGEYRRAA